MSIKINRAIKMYGKKHHAGRTTVKAIFENIPDELTERISSADLAMVMDSVSSAYKDGLARKFETE